MKFFSTAKSRLPASFQHWFPKGAAEVAPGCRGKLSLAGNFARYIKTLCSIIFDEKLFRWVNMQPGRGSLSVTHVSPGVPSPKVELLKWVLVMSFLSCGVEHHIARHRLKHSALYKRTVISKVVFLLFIISFYSSLNHCISEVVLKVFSNCYYVPGGIIICILIFRLEFKFSQRTFSFCLRAVALSQP